MMRVFQKVVYVPRLVFACIRLLLTRIGDRRKPAIGLVVDSFGYGGLEQIVLNLYSGYRVRGYQTYIISVTNQVSDMIQGIEDDPRHLKILHWSRIDLVNFCRKNNIRVLHYHYSIYQMPLMRMLGVRTIYTIHNTYVWFSKRAWLRTKLYLRFCDCIVAVSDFAKDYFAAKSGIKNIRTIINGIDIERFLAHSYDACFSRESMGVEESDIVFVNIASFSEQKYQLSLVGAMEKVVRVRDDIKLILVGGIGDKRLYDFFLRKLDGSPAKKYIKLAGRVPQDQLNSFLETVADAYVQPSLYEAGVPLSVMEALLCGLPTIMTDLDIGISFPLAKYIIPVSPPYSDLSSLSVADIRKITRTKNSKNQQELVDGMLYVADNLHKLRPHVSADEIAQLSIDRMIEQYTEILFTSRS